MQLFKKMLHAHITNALTYSNHKLFACVLPTVLF